MNLQELLTSMEAQIRRVERAKRTLRIHPDLVTPTLHDILHHTFIVEENPLLSKEAIFVFPSKDELDRFGGFEQEERDDWPADSMDAG